MAQAPCRRSSSYSITYIYSGSPLGQSLCAGVLVLCVYGVVWSSGGLLWVCERAPALMFTHQSKPNTINANTSSSCMICCVCVRSFIRSLSVACAFIDLMAHVPIVMGQAERWWWCLWPRNEAYTPHIYQKSVGQQFHRKPYHSVFFSFVYAKRQRTRAMSIPPPHLPHLLFILGVCFSTTEPRKWTQWRNAAPIMSRCARVHGEPTIVGVAVVVA